jgi:hypothetical protein
MKHRFPTFRVWNPGVSYNSLVSYQVRIGAEIPGETRPGAAANFAEQDRDRDWVEEHVAAPRREGRDILFAGRVLSWNQVRSIQIFETSPAASSSSPYQRGRRNDERNAFPKDVTHEFITGAPGAQRVHRADAHGSLAGFSDDQLIEELRRRLNLRHGLL